MLQENLSRRIHESREGGNGIDKKLDNIKEENQKLQNELLSLITSSRKKSESSLQKFDYSLIGTQSNEFSFSNKNTAGVSKRVNLGINSHRPGIKISISSKTLTKLDDKNLKEKNNNNQIFQRKNSEGLISDRYTGGGRYHSIRDINKILEQKQLQIDTKRRRQRIIMEEIEAVKQDIREKEMLFDEEEQRNVALQKRNTHLESDALKLTDIVAKMLRKTQELRNQNNRLVKTFEKVKDANV